MNVLLNQWPRVPVSNKVCVAFDKLSIAIMIVLHINLEKS